MTKKVVKKTVTETVHEEEHHSKAEKKHKEPKEKKMTAREREELMIENFVGLQQAMTNLSIKFGSLSDNITKLLNVFEESARNYASGGKSDNEDMLNKINSLLDQNKTIAKGLVLMEGKLRGRSEMAEPQQQVEQFRPSESFRPRPKPLPSI